MNDIAMTALFLVAFLKSDMSCLYGPLLNPEKYLAVMRGGKLPGRDGDEYPASLRSFFAFRSFDLYASGSSVRDDLDDLLQYQPRSDSRMKSEQGWWALGVLQVGGGCIDFGCREGPRLSSSLTSG